MYFNHDNYLHYSVPVLNVKNLFLRCLYIHTLLFVEIHLSHGEYLVVTSDQNPMPIPRGTLPTCYNNFHLLSKYLIYIRHCEINRPTVKNIQLIPFHILDVFKIGSNRHRIVYTDHILFYSFFQFYVFKFRSFILQ